MTNPYYHRDTDGNYYNEYPAFQIWEDGRQEGIREVVEYLGVYENELGFCEISNHIPYSKIKEWS